MTGASPRTPVEVPGGSVAYREVGEGPPIVFVHGLLVDATIWQGVAESVAARGFRCVLPSLPLGSHRTPMRPDADLSPVGLAAIIEAFMAALDLTDVTLVGNDTGGALCQLVVTRFPERVGRLVLTNCDAFERYLPPTFRYLQWMARVPGAAAVLAQTMRFRPMQRLPIAYGGLAKRPIPQDLVDAWVEPVRRDAGVRRDVTKALRGIDKGLLIDAATRFGSFERPVLLAWGVDDPHFRLQDARRMAELFPNARLEPIEDCRTFVPLDQPERLVELVAAFAGPT